MLAASLAVGTLGVMALRSNLIWSFPLSWRDGLAAITRWAWITAAVTGGLWFVWPRRHGIAALALTVSRAGIKALFSATSPLPAATSQEGQEEPVNDAPLGEGLPPLGLLAADTFAAEQRRVVEDAATEARAARIRTTLEKLRIPVVGVGAPIIGPAVTRFEFRIGEAARAAQVERVGRDVGAALGTQDVRVIYPVPRKPETVGIEVPNDRVARVYLQGLMADLRGTTTEPLTVALGRGLDGRPVFHDLAALPHLLIGGTTGSGKSSLLHAVLCSLICRLTPAQLRLVFVDPKMVELAPYKDLPHTLTMASRREDAAAALAWAVEETDRRYPLLLQAGVREIRRYNALPDVEPLPYVVIVVDEVAELMLGDKETRKAIEDAVQSLSQKARAAGVHLVVATQRPSVDVISGVIKANIPSRIALSVATSVDSGVILDQPGAEALVGKGDMLFLPVGAKAPVRVQGAYVTEEEVAALIRWWAGHWTMAAPTAEFAGNGDAHGDGEEKEAPDPLLLEAARALAGMDTVSVRALQERLGIRTAAAAALLNEFVAMGWVGEARPPRGRPVLLTPEEREALAKGEFPERSPAKEPEPFPESLPVLFPEAFPDPEPPIGDPSPVTLAEGNAGDGRVPALCHRCRRVVARVPYGIKARLRCPGCGEELVRG